MLTKVGLERGCISGFASSWVLAWGIGRLLNIPPRRLKSAIKLPSSDAVYVLLSSSDISTNFTQAVFAAG